MGLMRKMAKKRTRKKLKERRGWLGNGLASLSYGVEAELVETARGGDGSVIVDPLATVNSPVVVAVVVDGAVAVKHQAVLTGLFRQSSVGTPVELVTVGVVRVDLQTVGLGTAGVLGGCGGWEEAEEGERRQETGHHQRCEHADWSGRTPH